LNNGAPTTSTYNAANELVTSQASAGVTTNTYDGSGNLLTSLAPGIQWTTNTWDGENRLTQVVLPSGIVDSFAYNGDGLRVQKQDSTGTTKHVWDGQNILLETNASNAIQVVYTLEPALYGELVSQRRSGTTSFFQFDGLGSTRSLLSQSAVITDTYIYDSNGTMLAISGTTNNSFRFIGRRLYYLDADLLTYYIRRRIFDPASGRLLSPDPAGVNIAETNLYSYVGNDPVNYFDPSGLVRVNYGAKKNRSGTCGDDHFQVGFRLMQGDLNGRATGMIVQQVTRKFTVLECDGSDFVGLLDKWHRYYEAWSVDKNGTITPTNVGDNTINDNFRTCPQPNTCGYIRMEGEVVYIRGESITIGRESDGGNVWNPGLEPGVPIKPCAPETPDRPSGTLPWRLKPPAGWRRTVPRTGHLLQVSWCCCTPPPVSCPPQPFPCGVFGPCAPDSETRIERIMPRPS
jgi:RHS repeat-associated protein